MGASSEEQSGNEPIVELQPRAVPTGRPSPRLRQPSHELVTSIVERARRRPRVGGNAVDLIRRMRDGEDAFQP
ncbi:hypothetical protein DFR50_11067 [Roseiarcus fermentans]|uniref:Uncharacterized protein n=1 Tax=Roseiarcus fermentans TaxID=1473586 RepID=A0A366FH94_9HYPH|nr:hypothetical protein DFR50_11067 [Roseiarcus fermentans]